MEPVRTIEGPIAVLDRADVDTDQMIPKQFLTRLTRSGFGQYLFYDWVRSGGLVLVKAPILVTGPNFGCGSSREHAVWAIKDYGYRAIVAPSLADIFYTNCTKNGILPIALPSEDVRALMQAGSAAIDLAAQSISFAGRVLRFDIEPHDKERLLNGLDDIGTTLQREREISAYENSRAWATPRTRA